MTWYTKAQADHDDEMRRNAAEARPMIEVEPTTTANLDRRVEVAYNDLRSDPPKQKRVVCKDQEQLERWLTLHGDNVEVVATTTDF